MDYFFTWDDLPEEPHRSKNIVTDRMTRKLVVGKNQMVGLFTFKEAMTFKAHRHPEEQIAVIQRGRFRFRVGGVEREVGPGDIVLIPGNVEHSYDVLEPGSVNMDIFSPIREDFLAR